jgi:hypothetical protein
MGRVVDSVVARHQVYADLDPNFHVATAPDPDPDWHQNDADPHPTSSLIHVGKSEYFFYF